jgi:hypothetical protein
VTEVQHGGETFGFVIDKLNVQQLIKDYEKLIERRDNHAETMYDGEIKAAQEIWTGRRLGYWGVFVNYEREYFNTFSPSSSFTDFEDLFKNHSGDLFEAGANFNFLYQRKHFFAFARASFSLGRQSNFSDFTKSTIQYNIPTGATDATGNDVALSKEKTVYVNKEGLPYDFAFGYNPAFEVYGGHNILGVYSRIEFKEAIKNGDVLSKSLPFETGLYFNIESGEKDIVSILLFVNREDLFKHPDKTTNYGIKIGLPFEFSKKL